MNNNCNPSMRKNRGRGFYESNKGAMTNVAETESQFVVEVVLPGFDKSDIQINVEDSRLNITATPKDDEQHYTYQEFKRRTVNRSFRLPKTVDQEQIAAKMEHGILTITLQKAAQAIAKQIEIA